MPKNPKKGPLGMHFLKKGSYNKTGSLHYGHFGDKHLEQLLRVGFWLPKPAGQGNLEFKVYGFVAWLPPTPRVKILLMSCDSYRGMLVAWVSQSHLTIVEVGELCKITNLSWQ